MLESGKPEVWNLNHQIRVGVGERLIVFNKRAF